MLDDFLFFASSESVCSSSLHRFLEFCNYLGVPLAPEKTVPPSTCLTFLGIEIDTTLMQARLPLDKIHKCREHICRLLGKKSFTLRELQVVCGLLNFACQVVLPGRIFLKRLHSLIVVAYND